MQPAGPELAQILEEMRGLRADLRQTASVSSRTQVLLARMQLQEQRILHLDQERSAVAAKRMEAERALAPILDAQKRFEDAVSKNLIPRDDVQAMLTQVRQQTEQINGQRNQLAAQENEYANAIGAEQARWNQFNAELDELERALTR